MRTIKVYHRAKHAEAWTELHGVVYPFSFGNMLDERLDECYIRLKCVAAREFKPASEIKVEVYEGAVSPVRTYYYIVASPERQIVRRGINARYNYQIYCIERTKLLEAIVPQTITFTNADKGVFGTSIFQGVGQSVALASATYSHWTATTFGDWQPQETQNFTSAMFPGVVTSGTKTFPANGQISATSGIYADQVLSDEVWQPYLNAAIIGKIEQEGTTPTTVSQTWTKVYLNGTEQHDFTFDIVKGTSYTVRYEYGFFLSAYQRFAIEYRFTGGEQYIALKPWSVADVVDRVLDLAIPKFYGVTPARAYRLDPNQRNWLNGIHSDDLITRSTEYMAKAPEFTMTQCNLREQLRIIGGYIHAEPRVIDDPLHPGRGDLIHFDPLGENRDANITAPLVDEQTRHDINEYCTEVDSTASNIVNQLSYAQGVIVNPAPLAFMTPRSETINVRVGDGNGEAYTQYPVQDIIKVEAGVISSGSTMFVPLVDITEFVAEETVYAANLSSYDPSSGKSFSIYFTRGAKNLKGIFYKSPDAVSGVFKNYAISNILGAAQTAKTASEIDSRLVSLPGTLAFRISYIPIYDTRFSHSKTQTPGETGFAQIYNQGENLIETRYYGENVKGVAMRLGNIDRTATFFLASVTDVPQVGRIYDGYAISAVSVEVMPASIKCTVALTKDFNRISQYIGVNQNKRVYEVSESNAYRRIIELKDCIAVTASNEPYPADVLPGLDAPVFVKDTHSIQATVDGGDYSADSPLTIVRSYSTEPKKDASGNIVPTGDTFGLIQLPVISSAFGNAMTFSWQMKDNFSAGTQSIYKTVGGVSGYFQQEVPYGNYYGRAYFHTFGLLPEATKIDGTPWSEYDASRLPQFGEYPTNDLPINNVGKPYILRKDAREILSFNLVAEFVSVDDRVTVGSALAGNNPLVGAEANPGGEKNYIIVTRPTGKIAKYDREYIFEDAQKYAHIGDDGSSVTTMSGKIRIKLPSSSAWKFDAPASWAIVRPTRPGTTYLRKFADEFGAVTTDTTLSGGEILLSGELIPETIGSVTKYRMPPYIWLVPCHSITR